ncbi:hypothetical protein D9758_018453, partial [Tetrapyrgos nigripes]
GGGGYGGGIGGGGGGYADSTGTGTPPDSELGDSLLSPLSAASGGHGGGSYHGHTHTTDSPTGMSPSALAHGVSIPNVSSVSSVSGMNVPSVSAVSVSSHEHDHWATAATHSMMSPVTAGGYSSYFAMDPHSAHGHSHGHHAHSHPHHAHGHNHTHAHYGHVMSG